jgi:Bacterial TniB protein
MSTPTQEASAQEAFDRTLDQMLARHRRTTVPEPECRYIGDPPGKALALHYAARHPGTFCAETPLTPSKRAGGYLAISLLDQLGDPEAHKRDEAFQKARRLVARLRQSQVELVILTDVHRLVTPAGTKLLLREFDWLKWLFKNELKTIALVLVGEIEVLEEHIRANPQFGRLLKPIYLEQGEGSAPPT